MLSLDCSTTERSGVRMNEYQQAVGPRQGRGSHYVTPVVDESCGLRVPSNVVAAAAVAHGKDEAGGGLQLARV